MPILPSDPDPDPDPDPSPAPETAGPPVPAPRSHAEALLTSMLAAHVPVSLLLDLADPHGPCSAELLWREPGSADWLQP